MAGRTVTLPAHPTADWLPAHLIADWLFREWNTHGPARATPNVPGRGEASVAINLASPWRAGPSVQMRNAWHTLPLHPQSFTNVYTDELVRAPLTHFCKRGSLGFSSNRSLASSSFYELSLRVSSFVVECNFQKNTGPGLWGAQC